MTCHSFAESCSDILEPHVLWQVQYLVMLESSVATSKNEWRSSLVFSIPRVAPRNVNDVSCVATIKWTGTG